MYKKAVALTPNNIFAHVSLAATYGLIGREKEAKAAASEVLRINPKDAIEINKDFIPWIVQHHRAGAEVASLCIGAFLLAATGLLEGKKCSTHWVYAREFRNMFPQVNLVDDKIVTDENGIYSSGGAKSYWNLLIYLTEKYASRQMAVMASKYFLIEIYQNTQSPFTVFRGQKEHEDEPIKKAQEFIEANFQEKITVDQLAVMLSLGRRSFERRFTWCRRPSHCGPRRSVSQM